MSSNRLTSKLITLQGVFLLSLTPVYAAPALSIDNGIGRVSVDGVELSFIMGDPYDPEDEYPDDEPDLTDASRVSVYDDRGTFLAAVEAFEEACRTEPYPMNVDLERFAKLRSTWLESAATTANYQKATRQFALVQVKTGDEQTGNDFDWQSYCSDINAYSVELNIFQHLPDEEWSDFEGVSPAWMTGGGEGKYPLIDQVKFNAYLPAHPEVLCHSAPKLNRDNWRLVRASRTDFTINTEDRDQRALLDRYISLIDQATQRISWNHGRENDIQHLARVCTEYDALARHVDEGEGLAKNLPMDRIAGLYVVGVALETVQCPAGPKVIRNALEFGRQNGKSEEEILEFAKTNNVEQMASLAFSVEKSRRVGAMDDVVKTLCEVAVGSGIFLGLPNPD